MRPILMLCLLPLVGCASSNPRLFALEPRPGQVWHTTRGTVVVRRIAVPPYLERDEIVRGSGNGRLRVADNDWWSERLGSMVQRVLAADLAQRLPDATVLGTEAMGGEGATVFLVVSRFEPGDGSAVALDGTLAVEIAGHPRVLLAVSIRVRLEAAGTDAQVLAMSRALAEAADCAATILARQGG